MSEIRITSVQTRRDRRRFLTFPWKVYKNDPLWVPPLIPERMKAIDPGMSSFFQHGEAEFFIAWRDGKPVGTVCAAEDRAANQSRGVKDCVFGFFEYIEDYDVFEALLHIAREWAHSRDLTGLFGPFNLDYEDSYGVLIRGRDHPPALMCGHSPPYYQEFMERYGFKPARPANLAFRIENVDSPERQRLTRIAEGLRKRGNIHIRQVDFANWEAEIDRVHNMLLKALRWEQGGIPWRREDLESMVEPFRQIADPELVLFAEVDGEAVGWFPGIPNLNEVFIHVNGLRYPWDYLKLLWHMRRPIKSLAIKSVLVLPEYQKRGVAVLLFEEMARRATAKGYQWADLSITSEDNPDTVALADRLGAVEYKRWQVYRLLI